MKRDITRVGDELWSDRPDLRRFKPRELVEYSAYVRRMARGAPSTWWSELERVAAQLESSVLSLDFGTNNLDLEELETISLDLDFSGQRKNLSDKYKGSKNGRKR